MRTLIDGYNVMYAAGLLGKRFGVDGFRKVRTRFLNDLAAALGPVESALTTVVFDASQAPGDVPKKLKHKGIAVAFAVDVESADDLIEDLIAHHSAPKSLTVVSSDRRIRTAATRRKAKAVTADDFLVSLKARESERKEPAPPVDPPAGRTLSDEESAYWLNEFRDLETHPTTGEALGLDAPMLTDDEIAEIEREIEGEPD